ncbi:ABC transporter substrate-binding protein [Actinokineospora soli]|uniref:ABC transporter substrate-binding protein n=1 Tax=Actinokineospora soli TaxID=1048753 RepID=A0ABW2THP1_9PSEU
MEIRQAPERRAGQLTFTGTLLSDHRLRAAVAQAVNPQAITDAVVAPIAPGAKPVGNHLVPPAHPAYKDNSSTLPHNPDAARATLTKLGWNPTGAVRSKNGKRLTLRLAVEATPTGRTIGRLLSEQLLAVGIETTLAEVPPERLHDPHRAPGDFDLIAFERTKSPYPLSHDRPPSQKDDSGRVDIPEATALYNRATGELDQAKRHTLLNQIDVLTWQHAHHLPLYPVPGAYAVRATLANFGAPGLSSHSFSTAGFLN